MKYIVLALIYLYVLFMAWSAFGWMGIAYVVLVPLPFIFFSYLVRKRKTKGDAHVKPSLTLWTSPIVYFSLFFVGLIIFATVG